MRTIEAMQRQLLGLIGRAVVKSISAATKCQTVDVSLIAGEPKAGVEHLEPYGFTARANSGAEAVVLFPDGDRSHAVVVTVSDRRYRLKGLQTGEVAVYDDQGQSVTLTREGIVVDGAGKTITFRNAPRARFEMDLEVTGQVKDLCDSGGTTMSAMRLAYSRADFKVLINTGVVEHHSTILRMDIGLHHFYLLCYNITIKIHAHPDHFNTQSL